MLLQMFSDKAVYMLLAGSLLQSQLVKSALLKVFSARNIPYYSLIGTPLLAS